MTTDEEFIFEPKIEKNDIESVRKKFEGLMYLDPRCDPAFKALLDSEDSLVNFLNGIMHHSAPMSFPAWPGISSPMNNNYYVYILTNRYKTVFYTGVTNDLYRRTLEHKAKINQGFSEKYNADNLVYYEHFFNIIDAIKREERLKRWNRKWQIDLIEKLNPEWRDLTDEIGDARSETGMTEQL